MFAICYSFSLTANSVVVHVPLMRTLLAASTLAHTASIAALSSRRFCFFSFALLDFLYGNEWGTVEGQIQHV